MNICQDRIPVVPPFNTRQQVARHHCDPFMITVMPRPPLPDTAFERCKRQYSGPAQRCELQNGSTRCPKIICTPCIARNRRNFKTLIEGFWLGVCSTCRTRETRRSPAAYKRRRCICLQFPQLSARGDWSWHPWKLCEEHMEALYVTRLGIAKAEIARRCCLSRNDNPHHLKKRRKKPLTLQGARVRRAKDKKRLEDAYAWGVQHGLNQPANLQGRGTTLHPGVAQVDNEMPLCLCGRPVGYRSHPDPSARDSHYRTRKVGEIRNCAGCIGTKDVTSQEPRERRTSWGGNVWTTKQINEGVSNTTGWVRYHDKFSD
jgi:hypothetical protein